MLTNTERDPLYIRDEIVKERERKADTDDFSLKYFRSIIYFYAIHQSSAAPLIRCTEISCRVYPAESERMFRRDRDGMGRDDDFRGSKKLSRA